MLLTQRPITYGTQKPTLPLRTRPAKGSITEHLSVALSAEEASTGPITFVAFKSGQTRICCGLKPWLHPSENFGFPVHEMSSAAWKTFVFLSSYPALSYQRENNL